MLWFYQRFLLICMYWLLYEFHWWSKVETEALTQICVTYSLFHTTFPPVCILFYLLMSWLHFTKLYVTEIIQRWTRTKRECFKWISVTNWIKQLSETTNVLHFKIVFQDVICYVGLFYLGKYEEYHPGKLWWGDMNNITLVGCGGGTMNNITLVGCSLRILMLVCIFVIDMRILTG